MLSNTRTIRVEWGDCDPAGIVFYPRYFEMFERCIHALFEHATGMTKHEMLTTYDFVGFPVVQARAQFLSPATFGDDVMAETTISEFRRSSFDVHHRVDERRQAGGRGLRDAGLGRTRPGRSDQAQVQADPAGRDREVHARVGRARASVERRRPAAAN